MRTSRHISWLLFILTLGLGSCSDTASHLRKQGEPGPLAVRAINWNPSRVPIASVVTAVDDGSQLVLIGPDSATLLRAGTLVAVTQGRSFTSAAVIPAADGNGAWLVAIDQAGQLYRLRAGREFESVSDRYGFGKEVLHAACALGEKRAAFLIGNSELAIADGQTVTRYAVGSLPVREMVCSGERVALISASALQTFSVVTHKLRSFPVVAAYATFDSRGRLLAATADALYLEEQNDLLSIRYQAKGGPIRGLVSANARIWFAAGEQLGVVEDGAVSVTRAGHLLPLDRDVRLLGSATGDVFVIIDGQLQRLSRDDGALEPAERWAQLVTPVFARSCGACHLPGGRSGIDLSTAAAWLTRRSLIRERVIEKKTMPPYGVPFSEADRATILRWLDSEP